MVQHTVAKLEAWISVGASLCVCAAQLIRFVQQVSRLQDRWHAQQAGYLAAFDAQVREA